MDLQQPAVAELIEDEYSPSLTVTVAANNAASSSVLQQLTGGTAVAGNATGITAVNPVSSKNSTAVAAGVGILNNTAHAQSAAKGKHPKRRLLSSPRGTTTATATTTPATGSSATASTIPIGRPSALELHQRVYQQRIISEFSAVGIEEMRFVRIPYSGR
jgi:hypothetical protein